MPRLGLELPKDAARATGPELSVVVPIHNESENIAPLVARLHAVLTGHEHEIVFVDDGSRDDSLARLRTAAAADPRVKVVSLSRNFGHQIAVTVGMEYSRGKGVVIIDADLQDPPEVIPAMIEKWKEGFEVVYGVRSQRSGETWLKRATAAVFYRVIRGLTRFPIPVDTGDFRLVSRRVVDVFLSMPERQRFVRGMFAWAGFRQVGVSYSRAERAGGRTSYTYGRMMRLALDGITSFSFVPLHLASYVGFASAALGFVLILYTLYQKLYGLGTMRGWASLSVIVLFLGGVQLLMIGVLGQYVGRIHEELKHRPLYVVQETVNLS